MLQVNCIHYIPITCFTKCPKALNYRALCFLHFVFIYDEKVLFSTAEFNRSTRFELFPGSLHPVIELIEQFFRHGTCLIVDDRSVPVENNSLRKKRG